MRIRPHRPSRIAARLAPAFAALLMLPLAALAGTTLGGTVVDQQSHLPVPGVSVTVEGTHAGVTTDESGHFSLALEAMRLRLVFARVGYARKVVDLDAAVSPWTIELVPAAVPVSRLEVTGRAIERGQVGNAQSTGALTQQDLERGDGLTLENSINTLPGVQMQSRTPWGGAHIQIRGYYPNYSQNSNGYGYQAFLNDMPVTDATGQTILDDVDFSGLGRVEVINGPASSRYGTAIGGTVNFWTALPRPGGGSVSQQFVGGSDGLFRTNTNYATASDHAATVLAYGHQTYDSFRPNSGSRKDFARLAGEYKAGPDQTLSTYFAYNHSYEQIAGEIDLGDLLQGTTLDNPLYARNHAKIEIESERAGFTHAVRFDERLDARSTFYVATQTMSQPFAHGFSDYHRLTYGVRSALGVRTAVHGIPLAGSVGVSFQRTNYAMNGYFNPDPTVAGGRVSDQQNYAMNTFAFTEWNATLPAGLIASAGGNLSVTEFGYRNMLEGAFIGQKGVHRRAFDPKFLPRASLLKKFGDEFSVYTSVGTGYTPPSLTTIVNGDNTVNTSLEPETATQYEVGSKGLLLGKRLSYSLALFDLDIRDKLVSQVVSTVSSTVNVGEQRNRGVELAASALVIDDPQGRISTVRPWVSWTYSDFEYVHFKSNNNNNAGTVDFSGKRVARAPRHVMNLGLDVQAKCGGYLFASYQHVDAEFVTFDNSTRAPAYRLVNAKLGWQHAVTGRLGVDVSAGGDNLTGSKYSRFVFIGPTIAGLAQPKDGGTGDGYLLPGPYDATVFVNAKATWSF